MSKRDTYIDRAWIGLFVMLAILAAVAVYLRSLPVQPAHRVTAHVVRILPVGARFPKVAVVAETPRGISAQTTVPVDDFRCSVGAEIDAVQTGVSLMLMPATCRKPLQRSSTSRP